MQKIKVGDVTNNRFVKTVHAAEVSIPDAEWTTHLQFRRYAACPMCNLHLRDFVKRHASLTSNGIQEVVVFYSSPENLRAHFPETPFALIADPKRLLYEEFGVETSATSLAHPGAWFPAIRGVLMTGPQFAERGESVLGLPADFLIGTNGKVLALKYGVHAFDQWSVDEILDIYKRANPPAPLRAPITPN